MRKIVLMMWTALAFVVLPAAEAANTWGTDLSDLWVTTSEPGWGVNVAHQGDMMFVTFFVYGPDMRAKWYVASGMQSRGGSSPFIFDGDLYETTGPYLGGVFNPSAVGYRKVGTATFNAQFISSGTLTYSVDGAVVSKSISRYLFRYNSLGGSYYGLVVGSVRGCTFQNGDFDNLASVSVAHYSNNSISMFATFATGGTCTYAGTYSQQGRMGRILGTVTCSNGAQGSFDAVEIEAGRVGFVTRYTANYGGGCVEEGRISTIKQN